MLKHRTRRPVVSPRPSYARPARVRSQVCAALQRGRRLLSWLSTRPPRGPRCRCGCDAPSNESWTARLHARTRQRRPPPALPRDGRGRSVPTLRRTEGVGGRVAGERDPEARDSVGPGPRGFPPRLKPHLLAPAWGVCAAHCQHGSQCAACRPPLHRAMAVIAPSPLISLGSSIPLAPVYDPSVWVCTTAPSRPPLSHIRGPSLLSPPCAGGGIHADDAIRVFSGREVWHLSE